MEGPLVSARDARAMWHYSSTPAEYVLRERHVSSTPAVLSMTVGRC